MLYQDSEEAKSEWDFYTSTFDSTPLLMNASNDKALKWMYYILVNFNALLCVYLKELDNVLAGCNNWCQCDIISWWNVILR